MRYFFLLLILLVYSCQNQEIKPVNTDISGNGDSTTTNDLQDDDPDERFTWQKPSVVIEKLGDVTGKSVADIGSGTGYFTFRLLRKADKVIAIDIDPEMLSLVDTLAENLDGEQRRKLETRLATVDNPQLQKEEVDVIIIVNTIGYIPNRKRYLANLRNSLKPGGLLMITDFKIKMIPGNIAPPRNYRVSILDLENELEATGYTILQTDDTSLDYQYIVTARL